MFKWFWTIFPLGAPDAKFYFGKLRTTEMKVHFCVGHVVINQFGHVRIIGADTLNFDILISKVVTFKL